MAHLSNPEGAETWSAWGARKGHPADPRGLKLLSPTPNSRGWLSRGIHGAFSERGSGQGVPREGGAWPSSLTHVGTPSWGALTWTGAAP